MASKQDDDWYSKGLLFECSQCGDCCTGAEGYVWVNQAEIDAMAARMQITPELFEEQFVRRVGVRRSLTERPGGDCVLLDAETRGCTVYEDRPRQCRTWPFWNSNLKSEAAWDEAAESCPGCNKGDLVPLEKIQEQAARIRI